MAYLAAAKAQLGDYRAESARALLERGLATARTAEDLFALSCLHGDTLLDLGATPKRCSRLRECWNLPLTMPGAARHGWGSRPAGA